MPTLSVIIITHNEEDQIEECLQSVEWADEIIVVDAESSDSTREICFNFTPHVLDQEWLGFGPQKQKALSMATKEWVLSIDADERVGLRLKDEILEAIKSNDIEGYYLPRLTYVCGQPIRHSGWYPDYILRLFRRDKGKFTDDVVHEKIVVSGKTAKLTNHLEHFSYQNYKQVIDKFNYYSELGAEKLHKKDRKGGFLKGISSAFGAFFKLYIIKRGFLDGKMGFIVAITSAETAFYKYLKLGELNKKKKANW